MGLFPARISCGWSEWIPKRIPAHQPKFQHQQCTLQQVSGRGKPSCSEPLEHRAFCKGSTILLAGSKAISSVPLMAGAAAVLSQGVLPAPGSPQSHSMQQCPRHSCFPSWWNWWCRGGSCSLNSSTKSLWRLLSLMKVCLVNIVNVINQGKHNPRTVGIITSTQLQHLAGFFLAGSCWIGSRIYYCWIVKRARAEPTGLLTEM